MSRDDAPELAPGVFLAVAARHYLSECQGERIAARLPDFSLSMGFRRRFVLESTADLPPEIADEICSRAAELGVSAQLLLDHAALLYLADIHAGRAAEPTAADVEALDSPEGLPR